jgi:hypothetical protein
VNEITSDVIFQLREFESTYKPSTNTPTINAKDWPKTIESILEFLHSYLGEHKIPLAYVVRKDTAVPTIDPVNGYATAHDDMIARGRYCTIGADGTIIPDPIYITNREKVYEIIAKITRDHLAGLM